MDPSRSLPKGKGRRNVEDLTQASLGFTATNMTQKPQGNHRSNLERDLRVTESPKPTESIQIFLDLI